MAQVICEQQPTRPSTIVITTEVVAKEIKPGPKRLRQKSQRNRSQSLKLRRSLSGDLDNVVLMALQEPQRRYASVHNWRTTSRDTSMVCR
jgi:hypothetical protein